MHRRRFMALAAGAAIAPVAARAQSARLHRIGALVIGNADVGPFGKELRAALRALGHTEGQSFLLDIRSAEGQLGRLPDLAAELVRQKSDVIVALFTPCILAAAKATRDIPIVMVAGDAFATGLIESLSRPGGNVTGVSQMAAETHAKCIELFKDMLPSARRIAAFGNAADPAFARVFMDHVHRAGQDASVDIRPAVLVGSAAELDAAFAEAAKGKADAVVYQGSLPTQRLADLARANRLPTATTPRVFPMIGGLMSYGADGPLLYRRAALFAHRILQGSQPAEMPVEQPTKFELVINLNTAKELGLTVPPSLLARADELIE
jgi:putative ABC transport system substrate-binding protein